MVKDDLIDVLVDDMRDLYDLVYKGKPWKEHFRSQENRHAECRHIVRCLLKKQRPARHEDIAEAERRLIGNGHTAPDHSTIVHSCQMAEKYIQKNKKDLWKRLNFYYDVIRDRPAKEDPIPYLGRIAEFKREKDHVKSILLASLLEYGLVNSSIMQVMLNQYRDVPEDFVDELIETHL